MSFKTIPATNYLMSVKSPNKLMKVPIMRAKIQILIKRNRTTVILPIKVATFTLKRCPLWVSPGKTYRMRSQAAEGDPAQLKAVNYLRGPGRTPAREILVVTAGDVEAPRTNLIIEGGREAGASIIKYLMQEPPLKVIIKRHSNSSISNN